MAKREALKSLLEEQEVRTHCKALLLVVLSLSRLLLLLPLRSQSAVCFLVSLSSPAGRLSFPLLPEKEKKKLAFLYLYNEPAF